AAGGEGGFGELELPNAPNDAKPDFAPPVSDRGGTAGGMSFGELDLGGGADGGGGGGMPDNPFGEASLGSVIQPPPGPPPMEVSRVSQLASMNDLAAGGDAFPGASEATLEAPAPGKRAARPAAEPSKPSKAPRILGVFALLLIAGGGALELTPYGAFGRFAITDAAHAREFAQLAVESIGQCDGALKTDLYPDSRAGAEALAKVHAAKPRARAVTAVAATCELETELRFGKDPVLSNRAKTWLTHDIPEPRNNVRYLDVAQAGAAAVDG